MECGVSSFDEDESKEPRMIWICQSFENRRKCLLAVAEAIQLDAKDKEQKCPVKTTDKHASCSASHEVDEVAQ